MSADWRLRGYLFGACSCDWGCPCSFDARPTKGFCEGGYTWHVKEGKVQAVNLEGASFSWLGHSPGPLHEGNVTTQTIIDRRASPEQRAALLSLLRGEVGGPWTILASVTSKFLDPIFADYTVVIDGLSSKVKAEGVLEMELGRILNPVTGQPEELRLLKATGLTSLWSDLGRSAKFQVTAPQLRYDHSGLYGEFSEFEYTPEGLK